MTSSRFNEPVFGPVRPPEVEMALYGITRVPVDYFYYRGFRYTSLEDALAQARRSRPDGSSTEVENFDTD